MSTLATSALPDGRCVTPEIDLEALAAGYRHRPPSPATLRRALEAVAGLAPEAAVLDVGGGPGHHAATWAQQGYLAIVVDRADAMVRLANQHPGVRAVCGLAEALPLRDASVTVVYFHLSLHYGDWRRSLREATRVLAPGGRCVIWTLGPEHHRKSMLARWFPSVSVIDVKRFPRPGDVADELAAMGTAVTETRQVEFVRRRAGDWRRAVEAGFVSTLQLVAPAELQAGLEAFTAAHPDPDEEITYEMYWQGLTARVGPN